MSKAVQGSKQNHSGVQPGCSVIAKATGGHGTISTGSRVAGLPPDTLRDKVPCHTLTAGTNTHLHTHR